MQTIIKWIYVFLASRRFTVFNLIFLLINLAVLKLFDIKTLLFVTLSLCALFINLFCCFIRERGFRRWTMTVFHLFLLLFLLLSAYSSLYFFFGYLELAEGQMEANGYQKYIKGLLHKNVLKGISIYQGKISAQYKDDYNTKVKSLVRVYTKDERGRIVGAESIVISPLKSFRWKGYSIYLGRERGYSAHLLYKKDGLKKKGFVDFPSYAVFPERQKNDFTIPGEGIAFVGELNIGDRIKKEGLWELGYPEKVSLRIERGGEEYTLRRGDEVALKNGARLKFLGVPLWTDYVIYYNPLGKVLAIIGLGAFLSLIVHYSPLFLKAIKGK